MTQAITRIQWRRVAATAAIGLSLTGCGSFETRQAVIDGAREVRTGPAEAPQQTITNFSSSLRCMDNLFVTYGVRDVSVLVEDLSDQTKKVNAGTKDMLISAVSQMTVRSKAIRLVVYGQDSGNLIGFLRESQRRSAYGVLPEFDIKGSISQLDENLAKKEVDGGIGWGENLSVGGARTASSSVLAVDLTVLSTADLSVVPGVTSRNSVLILKQGNGVDGDARISKFGINFNMSLARSEGQAQALRTLVELASIELLGKLTKVPYWTCLGSSGNDQAVKNEISDWFYGMLADRSELVRYFQNQLRVRGVYQGPVDGEANPELADAVATYREALGLEKNYKVDLDFFSAYLNARHPDPVAVMAPRTPPAPVAETPPAAASAGPSAAAPAQTATAQAPAAPAAASTASATAATSSQAAAPTKPPAGHPPTPQAAAHDPIRLSVVNPARSGRLSKGEAYSLTVTPNRDAYVYCYMQDEDRKILRFFPNRFARDSLVKVNAPLVLPGAMRFQLVANSKGLPESVTCFATERDVLPLLPPSYSGSDFETLPVRSLDDIKSAFAGLTGNTYAEGSYHADVR